MAQIKLVQSLTRAFEFLHLVADTEEGLSLQELAQASGLKIPTVHNLMRTLVELGMIEKTNKPKLYRLGPSFLELADRYWDNVTLRRASDSVRTLAKELDDAIIAFAEYRGGDVVIFLRAAPHMPNVVQRPRNMVLSPYTSTAALIFQAYWERLTLIDFRKRFPLEEFGSQAWPTLEKLDEYLEGVREKGYACLDYDSPPGFRVAAPVFSRQKVLMGVLGAYIYGVDGKEIAPKKQAAMIEKVVAAANAISPAN